MVGRWRRRGLWIGFFGSNGFKMYNRYEKSWLSDEAIVDGETGFLFDHEDEINDILHKIVSDPSLQRKVKQNAWNVVLIDIHLSIL